MRVSMFAATSWRVASIPCSASSTTRSPWRTSSSSSAMTTRIFSWVVDECTRMRPLADVVAGHRPDDRPMQPQRTARVAVLAAALVSVLAASPAHADKWRVTSLSIKGTHVARYDDGDKTLDLDSTAFYKGLQLGKPFELRLSDRRPKAITAPASYVGGSEATYTTSGRAFKCDHFVHADAGIAAVLTVSPNA